MKRSAGSQSKWATQDRNFKKKDWYQHCFWNMENLDIPGNGPSMEVLIGIKSKHAEAKSSPTLGPY